MIHHPRAAAVGDREGTGSACFWGRKQKVGPFLFSWSLILSNLFCGTKTSEGFSGSRGRSRLEMGNMEMEKSWDVSEH